MINNVSQKILKNVAEYAPLVVFFAFYYIKKDLFWATGGLLVATVVSIIITIIMNENYLSCRFLRRWRLVSSAG